MKKILSILLVLIMLFACGCQGGGGNQGKDDRLDAIKPLESAENLTLYDGTWGSDFSMRHVDTDSYADAEELLNMFYDYLEGLGITAKIKAIYAIPMGMAGQYDEVLPFKIIFTDESVQPLYVVVLKDGRPYTAGYSCMGSFRDADVAGNAYFDKVLSIADAYDERLKNNLGFSRDDITLNFSIRMTRDLSFSVPDQSIKDLVSDTQMVYARYSLGYWPGMLSDDWVYINGMTFARFTDPAFTSIADLNTFLRSAFTDRIAQDIEDRLELTSGSSPAYVEQDGGLYVLSMGRGGNEFYGGNEVKYSAVSEDGSTLFVIIEGTWFERDDDWNPVNYYYSEDLFVYTKAEDGSWKCDFFKDLPFGMYETWL